MEDSQRRIYQYSNIDGTLELMMGVSLLLIGCIGIAALFHIDTELLFNFLPIAILLLFFGSVWFKQRVTYPRTGVVTPRRRVIYVHIVGRFVMVTLFGFSHLFVPDDAYLWNRGFPLLFGAFIAVVLLLDGHGLKRFYFYVVVALTTGVGSVAAGLGADMGIALTASLTGLVLIISGGRVLRRYLAEHVPPGDA